MFWISWLNLCWTLKFCSLFHSLFTLKCGVWIEILELCLVRFDLGRYRFFQAYFWYRILFPFTHSIKRFISILCPLFLIWITSSEKSIESFIMDANIPPHVTSMTIFWLCVVREKYVDIFLSLIPSTSTPQSYIIQFWSIPKRACFYAIARTINLV